MTDEKPKGRPTGLTREGALGCLLLAIVVAVAPAMAWELWSRRVEAQAQRALEAQEEAARDEFGPTLGKLAEGAAQQTYDIDKTVRVIHEIDLAMKDQESMKEYMAFMARQDYRDVAPEVLASRKRILEILFALYAKQTEAEDQKAMWELTSELLLSTLSVVSVSGEVGTINPQGGFSVDKEQAQQLLVDLKAEQKARKKLLGDLQALEKELFTALVDYSEVYYEHVDEWDRLCVLRDRAYLAVQNQDWDTALAASQAAIDMAPHEKEAHLIKAVALIEGGSPEDLTEAQKLLSAYIEEHPGSSAPAFLLMGVLEEKQGRADAAKLNFQQAAAYYPKQADQLTEMLNPYKMRAYLRKSREGGYILELYKSTMLGAGYFSPDLQLAKASFEDGDFHGGKQKVLDHFARRRSQEQWDFILSDVQFAHALLGEDFREIFPEDSYLDLVVSPTVFGNEAINVSVNNRSDETLRNATLILAVHFTDMHPGDYETFAADKTIPAVLPHASTEFGQVTVATELWGKPKDVRDIVQHRAILLTDSAVLWVDTDEFKIAEAKEFREARKADRPVPEQKSDWYQRMTVSMGEVAGDLEQTTALSVEPKYGFNDDVVIELPAKLALFKPVFTLTYGGQQMKADTNVIEGDKIVLRFVGVDNFDGKGVDPKDAVLTVNSVFGEMAVTWNAEGGTSYRFGGVDAP